MKKTKRILFVLLFFICICRVSASQEEIFNLENTDFLCADIKSNKLQLYVIEPNDTSHRLCPYSTGTEKDCTKAAYYADPSILVCNNTKYYADNLNETTQDNRLDNPWTWFRLSSGSIEIEGKAITGNAAKKYKAIRISNKDFEKENNIIKRANTLNSGETIAIRKKLDTAINPSDYSDLRLVFEYSATSSSDINLYDRNSLKAYVSNTNGIRMNSVKLANHELIDSYVAVTSDGRTALTKFRVTSENLVDGITENIKYVGFRPYDFYHVHSGEFRLISIKLIGYKNNEKYSENMTILNVSDSSGEIEASAFNNKVRHDIVNNMVDLATLKWRMSNESANIHFFHAYNTYPMIYGYDKNKNTVANSFYYKNGLYADGVINKRIDVKETLYGLPYVNTEGANGTVNTFISRTKLVNGAYRYILPTNYTKNTTTYDGDPISAGTKIGDDLYLHEGTNLNSSQAKITELGDHNYINNTYDYLIGSDCGKSVFTSEALEIPSKKELFDSGDYYTNAASYMLGNIEVSFSEVEKKLRKKGMIAADQQFTRDLYKRYYSSIFKATNDVQDIYKAYALLYPGDTVAKMGHVRMVSGRTHVVCNQSESGSGTRYTTKYNTQLANTHKGYCDDYGGIDGDKSYIITTEISSKYKVESTDNTLEKVRRGFLPMSDSSWNLTFNTFNKGVGITDIDHLIATDKNDKTAFSNVYSSFVINKKYTFNDLLYPNVSEEVSTNDGEVLNPSDVEGTCQDPDGINSNTKKYVECGDSDYYSYFPFRYKIMDEVIDKDKIIAKSFEIKNDSTISELESNKYLTGTIISNYMIESIKYIIKNGSTNVTKIQYPRTKNVYSIYNDIDSETNETINNINFNNDYTIEVRVKAGHSGYQTDIEDSDGYVSVYSISNIHPTSITLNKTSATINKGNTLSLTATVKPDNATIKDVTWTSSNTSVATVNSSGVVTAVKNGTAVITAKTSNGLTATCNITVKTPVSGISLNKTSTSIYVGSYETLVATVTPSDASNKNVTWSSSNTNVATVDSNGKVTGIKAGTATITVKTNDGNKTASCTVTVKNVAATEISLNTNNKTLEKGSTFNLTATISPKNTTNKTITWTSSNTSVATVSSSGVVTAVKKGSAVITAKTSNGMTATCNVTVKVSVTGVTLNKTSANVNVGDNLTLVATVSPSDANNIAVTWTSSNSNIASVDSNGKVTGIKAGTATITVKTNDGNKTASCTVTVKNVAATEISLNTNNKTLEKGSTFNLTATISPKNTTNKTITWTSSNTSVATVSSSGVVTAVKKGSAVITAKTSNGLTATCNITVVVSVSSISLDKTKLILERNTSQKLNVTINPSDASNKKVTWTSNKPNVATVNSEGVVNAISDGSATITVTSTDGSKKATCSVIVGSYAAPIFDELPAKISDENKVIFNLPINMTVETFINKVINNESVEIFTSDNKPKTSGNIATGDRAKYINAAKENDYYDISISGDVNGDGTITPLDYVRIKNHIMEERIINLIPFKLAADYNKDNDITPLDYVGIKNYIMKGGN